MRILADENILGTVELFGGYGDVRSFAGRSLTAADVENAEILLVRSVTEVSERLLHGSGIRFVGSATIGTDHIDTGYLRRRGIAFAHAPASNADSVAEYVIASLLRLCIRNRRPLRGLRVGIVGCGNIGGRLARRLPRLGVNVLLNDPPLQESDDGHSHEFVPLHDVLRRADAVTVHVPLVRDGRHPTLHLIGTAELALMQSGSWLINTSRGPVVDNQALKSALLAGSSVGRAVLDVWEGEPEPDAELVRLVDVATPHIAGYAYDAKLRGTWMLYRAFRRFLGESDPGEMDTDRFDLPPVAVRAAPDPALQETEWLDQAARGIYDILRDDTAMRRLATDDAVDGAGFSALRRDYPLRREFSSQRFVGSSVAPTRRGLLGDGLGVGITS